MYLKSIITIACSFILSWSVAQPSVFSLVNDTSSFVKDAHSIKQYERNEFTVTDLDKAVYKQTTIVTVLDKRGDHELSFREYADKFVKLEDVQVVVYNNLGLPEKTYAKKDFKQYAPWGNLIDDDIVYTLAIAPNNYPVTVSFNKTVRYKGIINYPNYLIQEPGQAVRHSENVVSIPKELDIRYYNQQTSIRPTISETGNIITYKWVADTMAAKFVDEGMLSWYSLFPRIYIAPNKFKYDNYPGDFTSWRSFGKWINDLAIHSLDLSDYSRTMIQRMVAGTADTKEKIKILYNYLQDNYRYVSIQLGIGGLRPFPASFTDDKKYGDCKGLSNYMQAMLAAINIKSYQALVNAGSNGAAANPDFPVDVFNHVILCVPLEKDSLWLECTSKYTDFGVLGNFTENRNALLITETGGVLVPTPRSMAKENRLTLHATVKLAETGNGNIRTNLVASGEYKFKLTNWLYNESADDQKSAIIHQLEMPAPETFNLQLPEQKKTPELNIEIDAGFEKVPSIIAGSKMFLSKQWHRIYTPAMPKKDERTQDFYFANPFETTDTTVYELPAGYVIDNLPKPIDVAFKYGTYHATVEYDIASNKVTSIAALTLREQHIPVADFAATKKFFSDVIKDSNQKIVIKKKE